MTNEYGTAETERLESFRKSFSKVYEEQNGFSREYALMREAEALNISLDEYRRLYNLSLRKPTLPSQVWKWTGFSEKKLWDYLQLLIVPILLAIGGFYLNSLAATRSDTASRERTAHDEKLAKERYQNDLDIASDRYQQETSSNYLNEMTKLLLDKHMRQEGKDNEVWSIARARTVTVLWKLDGQHKGQLLQFLKESNLITAKQQAIRLNGADLKDADLENADLKKADLSLVDLRGANLKGAFLQNADLSNAHLENANLKGGHLENTNLAGTVQCHTILPDSTESNQDCKK